MKPLRKTLQLNNSRRYRHYLSFVLGVSIGVCIVGYGVYPLVQLDRYQHAIRTQPTLALPATDTTELKKAIDGLEHSVTLLEPHFSSSTYAELEAQLYPIDFLRQLPRLEESRRSLLTTATLSEARNYHTQLQDTLDIYQNSLHNYRALFANFPNYPAAFLDGVTTATQIQTALQTVSDHVLTLQNYEQYQYDCMLFYSVSCWWRNEPNIEITHTTTPKDTVWFIEHVPDTIREQQRYAERLYSPQQPVAVLERSRCAPHDAPTYYLWELTNSRTGNLEMIHGTTINDLYFYDLAKLDTDNEYYKSLQQKGIRYSIQPTNPYLCLGFADDLGRIYTQHYLEQQSLPKGTPTDLIWRSQSAALPRILGLVDDMMDTSLTVLEHHDLDIKQYYFTRSYFPALLLFTNKTLTPAEIPLYRTDLPTPHYDDFRLSSYKNALYNEIDLSVIPILE